ncbi:MAG: hypothetical protein ABJI69_00965 [Balneola sp.]
MNNWNSVVRKKDTVFILGDLTMEKKDGLRLLDSLNGYKKIILGNHDKPGHVPELLNHVNSVCGVFVYKEDILLTHVPVHPNQFSRFRFNIHGHVHEESLDDERYINVSCEAVDYTPVLISMLIDKNI